MIDRSHALPVARQVRELGISRRGVYYSVTTDLGCRPRDHAADRRVTHEFPFAGSRMLRDLLAAEDIKVGQLHVQEDELRQLFTSRLFTASLLWKQDRAAGDMTLCWLFLLGLTTGARLEEIGQAMVADVKTNHAITYIDTDDYAATDEIKIYFSQRLWTYFYTTIAIQKISTPKIHVRLTLRSGYKAEVIHRWPKPKIKYYAAADNIDMAA
jgi:hypothetical protein